MNVEIDFQNSSVLENIPVDIIRFEKSLLLLSESLKYFIQREFRFAKSLHSMELAVEICGNDKIIELNSQYRDIDKATDVLSFELHRNLRDSDPLTIESLCLGDIMISIDKAMEQANSFKISLFDELVHLFVHGVIHLLGFDHELSEDEEKKMQKKETQLLDIFSSLYNKSTSIN